MKGIKEWSNIYKKLAMITQFGISVVMPLLLCILLCTWLISRFEMGYWIYVPGFLLGLGASFTSAYKFYLAVKKADEKAEGEKKVSFNRHK